MHFTNLKVMPEPCLFQMETTIIGSLKIIYLNAQRMQSAEEHLLGKEFLIRLQHDIREMDTDLKAEAIVASLIQKGIHQDQILIQPKGNSQRSYRKDVSGFYTLLSDYDNTEYLYIETHRDGFYDSLPENI